MKKSLQDTLETQVADARRTISSDGYPMSIGELTSMYRGGELIIRPEFQRFFRWTDEQKSRLVESLLLGIPLPSIFVAQQEGGKWELVDGLQRVSTILQLQGELRDEKGVQVEPLVLTETKYLKALQGRSWAVDDTAKSLSETLRLDIKRSKLDVKIIKRESSPETKYDLFQRLNSYGSVLTAQEMRSALLVAVSSKFFSWIESLGSYPSFRSTTQLSERLLEERYDLELVLRFLVLHNRPTEQLTISTLRDFPRVLDDESVALATVYPRQSQALEKAFKDTFDLVAANGGEKVFRRWDAGREDYMGSFLNTAFEVFALGIGYRIANRLRCRTDLLEVTRKFWAGMASGFSTGRSTEARLTEFVPLGRKLVTPPLQLKRPARG